MRSNRWRYAIMLAVLTPILASVACTDADDLASQTQNYSVALALTNPDPRFEQVEIQFGQVMVRPLDPDADASLTAAGLGLLRLSVLLSSLDTEARSDIALTNGAYGIEEISLNRLALRDFTPIPNPTNCIEYINAWSYNTPVIITPDDLGPIDPVVAESGGVNTLQITVDSSAYVVAFTESWICNPCGGGWCLDGFDDEAFAARAPEYLVLE